MFELKKFMVKVYDSLWTGTSALCTGGAMQPLHGPGRPALYRTGLHFGRAAPGYQTLTCFLRHQQHDWPSAALGCPRPG